MSGSSDISELYQEIPHNVLGLDQYDALIKKIEAHPEMGKASESLVDQAIELAFDRHRQGYSHIAAAEHEAYRAGFVADSFDSVKRAFKDIVEGKAIPNGVASTAHETPALENFNVNKFSTWANRFTPEQKMHAGVWGAGAALGALFTIGAAKNTIAKDEDGKSHILWLQAAITLLQAALTVGSAYMAFAALHSGAQR